MKWNVPGDLPVVVANPDGVVEDCAICGEKHRHGSATAGGEFQRCRLLGPGYYYVNIPTRASSCPSDEYTGDYLLAYELGDDHPYLDGPSKREYPDSRRHETYQEDHWEVLDVDDVDKVFSTIAGLSDDRDTGVRIDFDGYAAASVMRDLADEGDNVCVSAWFSIDVAEQLADQLTDAITEAKMEDQ